MLKFERIFYFKLHIRLSQNGIKSLFEFSSIFKEIDVFMKDKSFIYSDLSKKQLENLKEFYIQKKVESMSNQELKQYVLEIISHQINNTIGKEEEIEAWGEMSDFFGEQFETVILEIQKKYSEDQKTIESEIDPQKQRLELLERNNLDKEKKDMWDD